MVERIETVKIKKGLRLPISGEAKQVIEQGALSPTVALLGPDYVGMKPTMLVKEGDEVRIGEPLFTDKKNEGVVFTSPGSGKVLSINRGAKRAFVSIVIEQDGRDEHFKEYPTYASDKLSQLDVKEITDTLVESGLWTALRTRPFSKSPQIGSKPSSIFVTATDTNPLAPDPNWIIKEELDDFQAGMCIVSKLAEGKVFLCRSSGDVATAPQGVPAKTVEFEGPHPSGLVGTHIHYLDPVSEEKTVWHIGYQDVIAFGKLFTKGKIWTDRLISLAGPMVANPRLIRTRVGASLLALTDGEIKPGKVPRILSGSVLSGVCPTDICNAYLGRFHSQISVLPEGGERELLGWHMPGFNKFSVKNVFFAKLFPSMSFDFSTTTNGSKRSMVPIGMFESVLPLDIVAPYFLRSLISQDAETAQALGALELDEEDLSLCTFVCPGKTEYGPLLRETLVAIEKEGL